MITYDEALDLIGSHVIPLSPIEVPASDAHGLVLSSDIKARFGLPRFDQSAMDGVAVRSDDLASVAPGAPAILSLAGESAAGRSNPPPVTAGHAVKVFTGAPLPDGADAVVVAEACVFGEGTVIIASPARAGDHIRWAGEETAPGQVVLEAHQVLTPPAIGVLATFGVDRVSVNPMPRVCVIIIGEELVGPGGVLTDAMIHDANGPALRAAALGVGVTEIEVGRVGDDLEELVALLEVAVAKNHLVITVGGASVGDHDYVAEARGRLGITEVFDRIAIKPGKPNLFGVWRSRTAVFGLPGNPVSALVSFHQLVAPAISLLCNRGPRTRSDLGAVLDRDVQKKPGRLEWLRGVVIEDGATPRVAPISRQGSHMLTGLARADVLIEIPADVEHMRTGERVNCIRLGW